MRIVTNSFAGAGWLAVLVVPETLAFVTDPDRAAIWPVFL